jgi:hypothetical protein
MALDDFQIIYSEAAISFVVIKNAVSKGESRGVFFENRSDHSLTVSRLPIA